jgi:hypothetical protein
MCANVCCRSCPHLLQIPSCLFPNRRLKLTDVGKQSALPITTNRKNASDSESVSNEIDESGWQAEKQSEQRI